MSQTVCPRRREIGGGKVPVKATRNERSCQTASQTVCPGYRHRRDVDKERAKQSTQIDLH